ncbi:MAG TPA: beta-ketoacyl-ACP synthase III [Acidiferrobacteraceae bacterium]|nr:beta-ketoacyl-ACP synthase III [Acidiferrobacteraceae bacterium]
MRDVFITGLGAFFPNAPVSNDAIETVLGQAAGKPSRARRLILERNGIAQRHYAIDPNTRAATHSNAVITAEAVRAALAQRQYTLADVGCLACGTSSPDQIKPAHAHMVQGVLQAPAMEIGSVAGVCTAGVSAMKYAWMNVATGAVDCAVSTGSELASSFMRAEQFGPEPAADVERRPVLAFEQDFLRWMLSDGAGAAVLEARPRPSGLSLRIDWIDCISYAGELPTCMYSGALPDDQGVLRGWREVTPATAVRDGYFSVRQDTRLLDKHIVDACVTRALGTIQKRRSLKADDIRWFLPHYSSEYFRPRLHEALEALGVGIPYERWFTNMAHRGNVGSAMLYVILEELFYSGRIRPGDRILCLVPESARFSACYAHLTAVEGHAHP